MHPAPALGSQLTSLPCLRGRAVCEALHAWGIRRGAQRVYVQVLDENTAAIELYASLGYGLHHHVRYVDARRLLRTSL